MVGPEQRRRPTTTEELPEAQVPQLQPVSLQVPRRTVPRLSTTNSHPIVGAQNRDLQAVPQRTEPEPLVKPTIEADSCGNPAGQSLVGRLGVRIGGLDINAGAGILNLHRLGDTQYLVVPVHIRYDTRIGSRLRLTADYGYVLMPETTQITASSYQHISLGSVFVVADGEQFGLNLGLRLEASGGFNSFIPVNFDLVNQGQVGFGTAVGVRIRQARIFAAGRFFFSGTHPYDQNATDNLIPHFLDFTGGVQLGNEDGYRVRGTVNISPFTAGGSVFFMSRPVAALGRGTFRAGLEYIHTSEPFENHQGIFSLSFESGTRGPRIRTEVQQTAGYGDTTATGFVSENGGFGTQLRAAFSPELQTELRSYLPVHNHILHNSLAGVISGLPLRGQVRLNSTQLNQEQRLLVNALMNDPGLNYEQGSILFNCSYLPSTGQRQLLIIASFTDSNGRIVDRSISIYYAPNELTPQRITFDHLNNTNQYTSLDITDLPGLLNPSISVNTLATSLQTNTSLSGFAAHYRGRPIREILEVARTIGGIALQNYDRHLASASIFGERGELAQLNPEVLYNNFRENVLAGQSIQQGICANINGLVAEFLREAGVEAYALAIPVRGGAHVIALARDPTTQDNFIIDYDALYTRNGPSAQSVLNLYATQHRIIMQGIYVYGHRNEIIGRYQPEEGRIMSNLTGETRGWRNFMDQVIEMRRRRE